MVGLELPSLAGMAKPHALALLLALRLARASAAPQCPGSLELPGYGDVHIIPTGWADDKAPMPNITGRDIMAPMDSRAYFGDACNAGVYSNEDYLALNLLGKTMKYSANVHGAGCGCNAAMYLVSMRQNTEKSTCGDYYCDANSVCGIPCAEIDIQEANMYAWHSTLHSSTDRSGIGSGSGGGGNGWSGPRDWDLQDYGPGGRCIDTTEAFDVAVSFPEDSEGKAWGMEVELTQSWKECSLKSTVSGYKDMPQLNDALSLGMTPVFSYWSNKDMLWMDGKGSDGSGPCAVDEPKACAEAVKFSNFRVFRMDDEDPGASQTKPSTTQSVTPPAMPQKRPTPAWMTDEDPGSSQTMPSTTQSVTPPAMPQKPTPAWMTDEEKASVAKAGEKAKQWEMSTQAPQIGVQTTRAPSIKELVLKIKEEEEVPDGLPLDKGAELSIVINGKTYAASILEMNQVPGASRQFLAQPQPQPQLRAWSPALWVILAVCACVCGIGGFAYLNIPAKAGAWQTPPSPISPPTRNARSLSRAHTREHSSDAFIYQQCSSASGAWTAP